MKKNIWNKITKVLLGAFLVGFAWFGGLSLNAFAEDNNTAAALTLSPMSQKIILTPGETYEGTIKVINSVNAENDLNYEASVGSYSIYNDGNSKDDYGSFDVNSRSNYNIMMDWTTIENPTGVLKPNETAVLNFKIKVPKSAPAGAQYISIIVANKGDESAGSNKSGVSISSKYQLASVIYANVAGETIEKGVIKENSVPTILTSGKLEATSKVRNEGNVYTDASYVLQVWPAFSDEEICTNEEKNDLSLVLPNTERFHVQTCDLPAVGIFRVKQVVSIFGEKSVVEKTILVCPVWLMVLVLIIIVGIIVAAVVIIRKNKGNKGA